jgi:hypothetical protein
MVIIEEDWAPEVITGLGPRFSSLKSLFTKAAEDTFENGDANELEELELLVARTSTSVSMMESVGLVC